MRNGKEYKPKTMTDIKILLLFLLDNIRYPVDADTLRKVLYECVDTLSLDYDECLGKLLDEGHVLFDDVGGVRYYMISATGRALSAELYDTLDPVFREKSLKATAKYMSLSGSGTEVSTRVNETSDRRFVAVLKAKDESGEIFSLSLTVNSKFEAEAICKNFSEKPDSVYRGILFSATGKVNFLS